ncbi:MAG TPA: hypothetical protein VK066_17390 [Chloroflexota bacterium]|nr:hypothetical protein [Chloroflexota bacterium]
MGFAGSALSLVIAVVGLLAARPGSGEWLLFMASAGVCTLGCIGVRVAAERQRTGAFMMVAAAIGGPGTMLLGGGVVSIVNASQDAFLAAMFVFLWIFWLPLVLGLLVALFLLLAAAHLALHEARTNATT